MNLPIYAATSTMRNLTRKHRAHRITDITADTRSRKKSIMAWVAASNGLARWQFRQMKKTAKNTATITKKTNLFWWMKRRWQQLQKEAMIKKLAAVKALAENGVGGEKETARRMHEDLKAKYGITDGEVAAVKEPAAAEVKKEFSDIAFALWVLANNLDDEMKICRDCPDRNNPDAICAGCATDENIKDLKAQYEELTAQFERGCAG